MADVPRRPRNASAQGNWYEDDQFASISRSPGAVLARDQRVELLSRALDTVLPIAPGPTSPLVGLDAGAGDGVNLPLLAGALATRQPDSRVVALDYWWTRATRAASVSPLVVSGSVDALPLRSGSVDLVLLSHVVEHVKDPRSTLQEAARVLKPGGGLVVAVPNEGCLLARLRNRVLQRSILDTTDHIHFFTMSRLIDVIAETGSFSILHTGREGFFVPHLRASMILRESRPGRGLLTVLSRLLPSQSAGLVCAAVRIANNSPSVESCD